MGKLGKKSQQELLKVAKRAVVAAVNGEEIALPKSDDPELNQPLGCFVSLFNTSTLRGRMGKIKSDDPVIRTVHEMAIAAATKDPHFLLDPIEPHELAFLIIHISTITPPKQTWDPLRLRLGIDGVYITDGENCGTVLPQVAKERNWTQEQLLVHCCVREAELPADAWADKDTTKVYLFTADTFSEKLVEIRTE